MGNSWKDLPPSLALHAIPTEGSARIAGRIWDHQPETEIPDDVDHQLLPGEQRIAWVTYHDRTKEGPCRQTGSNNFEATGTVDQRDLQGTTKMAL